MKAGDGNYVRRVSGKMRPAIFFDPRIGRVVKDNCESVGITMTQNDEWWTAALIGGVWFYFPEAWIRAGGQEDSQDDTTR